MPPEITQCPKAWKVVIKSHAHTLRLDEIKTLHSKLGGSDSSTAKEVFRLDSARSFGFLFLQMLD